MVATPQIDPRHFQDIVDEAKRRIVQYCPEWTDHNVGDPGVALIELFAWMTDLIRYRLNNVPERDFRQFLKLIGARPRAAVPAVTELTFWLSAAQADDKLIPAGTEVMTQASAAPSVTFSTDRDLWIRPPELRYVVTEQAPPPGGAPIPRQDATELLEAANPRLAVFAERPRPGDALYLGFRNNLGGQVVRLTIRCATAQGFNIIPDDPPLVWEFWDGAAWQSLQPEPEDVALLPLTEAERATLGNRLDSTAGLNESGVVILLVPRTATLQRLEVAGGSIEACWVRCRAHHRHPAQPFYNSPPVVQGFVAESIGGMVTASHVFTVRDEELGRSDGSPGQSFRLANAPVLPRDPGVAGVETLLVEGIDGGYEPWTEVGGFGGSGPGDPHFLLDDLTGTLTLGPAVRDVAGQERQYGRVPAAGRVLRFSQYRGGGGSAGNVGRGTLVVPRSSSNLDYVSAVTNLRPATGGRDGESLEQLLVRGPDLVRTRDVAVTRGDFERLVAQQFPQVARVLCLPVAEGGPGVLVLLSPVLPGAGATIRPEDVALGQEGRELCRRVRAYLEERSPLTTEVVVSLAEFRWVSVAARLAVRLAADLAPFEAEAQRFQIRTEAAARLNRLLHPSHGGSDGTGWPFGRTLSQGDVFALLEQVPGVRYVDQIMFRPVRFDGGRPVYGPETPLLNLEPGQVLCAWEHDVTLFEPGQ